MTADVRSVATESLVFINYRTRDTAAAAALLHTEFTARLGENSVFLDYESIEPGRNFGPQLLERVRGCAVLLVVVGARWLDGVQGERAIDRPDDWVRQEIVEAMANNVPVMPVLVEGATLQDADLPPELADLPDYQYFALGRRLRADIGVLIDNLTRHIPRLRDRPVEVPAPYQALVAALHSGIGPGAESAVRLTVDVNQNGTFDHVTLTRTVPRATDRQLDDTRLVGDLAHATGLRADPEAENSVREWFAEQARDGRTTFDRLAIERAADELHLRAGPPRAVVSVATVKPDPLASEADHTLDWVDRFAGATPYAKRRPLPPATWQQLQDDIEDIPHHLPRDRTDVLITGNLRQATAFTIGGALRMVNGLTVAVNQGGRLWSSDAPYQAPLSPITSAHHLDLGDDLGIALAVATNPTADVLTFIVRQNIPIARLLTLGPATPADNAIPDAGHAVALATGMRDTVRRESRRHPRVHLFLAGPNGLALLLGHRWNRVRPTLVYEDLNTDPTYEHAFTVDA